MKIKKIVSLAALLLVALPVVHAQVTLVDWTFDNASNAAPILHPAPSAGLDLSTAKADTVGMTNSLTIPSSIGAPDVIANPAVNSDSTPLLPDAWRVRAKGTSPNTGNGWDNAATIGTQGAVFYASTLGYYNIQLTFDVTATTQGEGYLQVEYTTDGINWSNAPITYSANPSLILTNATPGSGTNGLVIGSYLNMVMTGTYSQLWFTNVTANLSGISGVNNNTNFAVRIVNAATGTNCLNANGGQLNNTSGNWSLDNILITGTPPPTPITAWDFDTGYSETTLNNSPVPSIGAGVAICLGMTNSYNSASSLASCDITSTPGASTGANSAAWRVRGGGGTYATIGSPNGWSSQAPLGTQGAEFDASTVGYNNVQLSFDLYFTTAAPAQMQVEYTTDGITWNNASTLAYAANPAYILTNSSDPNTVDGTYFSQTGGQGFYTNITATFPSTAAGNPNFGVRVVNATTGTSDLSYLGAPYNNNSGNWRFDNVVISGTTSGAGPSPAPVLAPDANASVDHPFTNTFTSTPAWQYNITNITVNGITLPPSAYSTNYSGEIVFTPSVSSLLQTNGVLNIVIGASGYGNDKVSQYIASGAATSWSITTQPMGPTGNGGTLVMQPIATYFDQYGNTVTNVNGIVTASPAGSWSFGVGSGVANGTGIFTNLSATSTAAVSGATITLTTTVPGMSANPLTSSGFNIPAPATTGFAPHNLAVFQEDVASKNSTFSILELSPSSANQTSPVNVFPISATGSNALRQSSAATTGRMADSDDGTLVCFTGFETEDGSLVTTPDVTVVNPRGVGTLNTNGAFVLQTSYIGVGGSTANQTRSATTVDDVNWFIGDKGGVYVNNGTSPLIAGAGNNVRSLKSFGGTVYALQQASSSVINTPISIVSGATLYPLDGFSQDASVLDFYMIRSGANGSTYDTVYYIDGTNTTSGAIYKYYLTQNFDPNTGQQLWALAGSVVTTNGGDGLCAATNASGGVDLYYTTGNGGIAGNSLVKVHDSAPDNTTINLSSPITLYTVASQATLKGVAFAPVSTNVVTTGTPSLPINITPGSTHLVGVSASAAVQFSFTNTPSLSFSVLATNIITAPKSTWPVIGTVTDNPPGSGQYQFTDLNPATNGTQFYILRQP